MGEPSVADQMETALADASAAVSSMWDNVRQAIEALRTASALAADLERQ